MSFQIPESRPVPYVGNQKLNVFAAVDADTGKFIATLDPSSIHLVSDTRAAIDPNPQVAYVKWAMLMDEHEDVKIKHVPW